MRAAPGLRLPLSALPRASPSSTLWSMSERYVFDRAPLRVYWETTRACDLACRHCRAEAAADPDPSQLTTAEGLRLLEDVARFGVPLPHVILTGGDPLKRPDLFTLIAHARALGFAVSVAPSGTPLLTAEAIARLAEAGVEAISLSLDGASAARHDGLRGVEGCYTRTLAAATAARAVALPFQVNTLVCELYTGRCSACEFRGPCGGSRARAFAASGDPLGEDPLCAHRPTASRPAAASPPA